MSEQEWAIRDEASGEWWSGEQWGALPWRFATYPIAMNSGMKQMQAYSRGIPESVRIVPAPPREMSDEECWKWFHDQPLTLSGSKLSMVWDVFHYHGDKITWASTPIDAIRAARCAAERLAGVPYRGR